MKNNKQTTDISDQLNASIKTVTDVSNYLQGKIENMFHTQFSFFPEDSEEFLNIGLVGHGAFGLNIYVDFNKQSFDLTLEKYDNSGMFIDEPFLSSYQGHDWLHVLNLRVTKQLLNENFL